MGCYSRGGHVLNETEKIEIKSYVRPLMQIVEGLEEVSNTMVERAQEIEDEVRHKNKLVDASALEEFIESVTKAKDLLYRKMDIG